MKAYIYINPKAPAEVKDRLQSIFQWLEHRSPNSASAIPPNSIACRLYQSSD
jgi:hypothetical protein